MTVRSRDMSSLPACSRPILCYCSRSDMSTILTATEITVSYGERTMLDHATLGY